MSNKRQQELLDFCLKQRLPVIEDGAYQELCYENEVYTPIKALDTNDMVIYLGTASKTLSPGLRIGYLVAPQAIVQRLGHAENADGLWSKFFISICFHALFKVWHVRQLPFKLKRNFKTQTN